MLEDEDWQPPTEHPEFLFEFLQNEHGAITLAIGMRRQKLKDLTRPGSARHIMLPTPCVIKRGEERFVFVGVCFMVGHDMGSIASDLFELAKNDGVMRDQLAIPSNPAPGQEDRAESTHEDQDNDLKNG